MKEISLCADDFGWDPAINEAVLQLFKHDRISASSCMTNADYFNAAVCTKLSPYANTKNIGLHFNLTAGKPLTLAKTLCKKNEHCFLSLSNLLLHIYLKRIDPLDIQNELQAQLEKFVYLMKKLPSHIDGHQHIHQFPIIREILVPFVAKIQKENPSQKISLRHVKPKLFTTSPLLAMKKQIIRTTGQKQFFKLLQQYHLSSNQSFSGIYNFKKTVDYRKKFLGFIAEIGEKNGLIMLHPAIKNIKDDPIARETEFQYFNSEIFLHDQKKYQFIIKAKAFEK